MSGDILQFPRTVAFLQSPSATRLTATELFTYAWRLAQEAGHSIYCRGVVVTPSGHVRQLGADAPDFQLEEAKIAALPKPPE